MSLTADQPYVNDETLLSRLASVFRDVFDAPDLQIVPATTAADIDEWDSVGYITLIVSIEREFDIEMIGPEIGELRSVGDILSLIEKRQAASA